MSRPRTHPLPKIGDRTGKYTVIEVLVGRKNINDIANYTKLTCSGVSTGGIGSIDPSRTP